jgi:hypothetical protein
MRVRFQVLKYINEDKVLELIYESSRRPFTSPICAQSQAISRGISDLESTLGQVFFLITSLCSTAIYTYKLLQATGIVLEFDLFGVSL